MESRKTSLPKKTSRPPRPATEEEKQALLLLVLLRLAELVERRKLGVAVERPPASPIRRVEREAQRSLMSYLGAVFKGRMQQAKKRGQG